MFQSQCPSALLPDIKTKPACLAEMDPLHVMLEKVQTILLAAEENILRRRRERKR